MHVEGLGKQLYPELDIWSIARPMLEQWLHRQMGPKALAKSMQAQLPLWLAAAPDWPEKVTEWLLLQDRSNGLSSHNTGHQGQKNKLTSPSPLHQPIGVISTVLFAVGVWYLIQTPNHLQ